jgi:hypothetical protein
MPYLNIRWLLGRRCNVTSRISGAGHVIDDLINSHRNLIDSHPNEA